MAGDAAEYIGNIPQYYDRHLGSPLFVDYATDISRRVAAYSPRRVLETAAGTGIVTRQLRNQLPADVRLTATDLNPPMLEIARSNHFRSFPTADITHRQHHFRNAIGPTILHAF